MVIQNDKKQVKTVVLFTFTYNISNKSFFPTVTSTVNNISDIDKAVLLNTVLLNTVSPVPSKNA